VYLFTARIHDAVAAIEPSSRGELEITDAIQWLIDQGETVRHEVLQGWWIDTGKKDPLLECNRMVLDTLVARVAGKIDADSTVEGRVVIEEGAALINSRVRGPAIIGSGARVVNSYIGPYSSIASGCEIVDSDLDHSVVLERSRIIGVTRLTDSLIGRDVEVRRSQARPAATRMMLGDDSRVELE
jgi:glucose-1-phosphate thymidylyltransferase